MGNDRTRAISSLGEAIEVVAAEVSPQFAFEQLRVFLAVVTHDNPEGATCDDIVAVLGAPRASVARNLMKLTKYYNKTTDSLSGWDLLYASPNLYNRKQLSYRLSPKGTLLVEKLRHVCGGAAEEV